MDLFLGLACAAEAPGPEFKTCHSNADCPSGEICYLDGCGSSSDFAVRVTPNSSDYVVQDFNPVTVAMSQMDLTVSNPGIIEGDLKVRTATGIDNFKDGFTIQATGRSSIIPGLTFSQPVVHTVAKNSSRFSFALPPGSWQVRAIPTPPLAMPSGETPAVPLIPPVFVEKAVGSGDVVDPALVLAGDGLNEVQGRLLVAQGVPWPDETPVFFRFQALDPVSLVPLSQPAVFLTSSTFHVFTASTTGPLLLRVSPDPQLNSSGALLPTKEFLADESTGSFGPFEMGDWGSPVEVQGTVAEKDPSSTPETPVAGPSIAYADIRAEGTVKGGGKFAAASKTDADGKFTLKLLPSAPGSKYLVSVSPRYGSTFASTTYSLFVEASQKPVALPAAILCPAKAVLTGRVLAPIVDGQDPMPLGGVPILVDGNPSSATPGTSTLRDVITNADGTFKALVEPGAYQVVAAPASDFPWSAQSVTTTGADAVIPDFVLESGRLVSGTLSYRNLDGSQTAVGGATVSIFRSPTSSLVAPLKIYEALSDSTGRFKVILPKPAQSTTPSKNPWSGQDAGMPAGPDAGRKEPLTPGLGCSQSGSPLATGAMVLASLAAALLGRWRRQG
ncbi:MAG: hypothetical protein QM765_05355 [Myxococcales bacterium]